MICQETTTKLLPDDLKYGVNLGGGRVSPHVVMVTILTLTWSQQVVFTKDEKLKLKQFGEPGIRSLALVAPLFAQQPCSWHACMQGCCLWGSNHGHPCKTGTTARNRPSSTLMRL
jgi:hypothetical protein